jgi:uncharacterized protein (TIGR03083 family)
MHALEPIETVDLLPALHVELLALLRTLSPADWRKPTIAEPWTVPDMAAHLLDTDIRRLSFQRDGLAPLPPPQPISSYQDLVAFLNQLNGEWVAAARRISPQLLIGFLELIGPEVHALFKSLDPNAPASISVAWAGEDVSLNWFDIAREYTEKWHHQQHIREAVGAPLLTGKRWLAPVLDTFLRGLPHTYRDVVAPDGVQLTIVIDGEAGGVWTLRRQEQAWRLYAGANATASAQIALDQDIAWRLFTKGISSDAARSHARISGDESLAAHLLQLLAIMA